MSNYSKYTEAERKAWGAKMQAAKAAKRAERERAITGRGAYRKTGVKKASSKPKRAVAYKGRGAYVRDDKDPYGKQLGGLAGSYLGELAGGALQSLIGSFTGLGAYNVKKNVLLTQDPPPIINIDKRGGVVIRHREYLGDITTGTGGAFKLQAFPLNPGQEGTFPWLSQVAANYEEYSLEGCIFEFRSMSADALNSTNTALGTVIMATNYNAGNPNFTNKIEMENYEFGCSGRPSENLMHPIECDPRQTAVSDCLYVRPDLVPAGQAVQLFDWGNFQIATIGFQASGVNIGELWITYQVSLLKPKMFTSLGKYNDWFRVTITTGMGNSTPLGTLGTWGSVGNSTLSITQNSAIQFQINGNFFPQMYYIKYIANGGAAAVVAPTITLTNATAVTFGTTEQYPPSGTSSGGLTFDFMILTAGNGAIPLVSFGTSGTLPTGPTGELRIMQVANSAFQ